MHLFSVRYTLKYSWVSLMMPWKQAYFWLSAYSPVTSSMINNHACNISALIMKNLVKALVLQCTAFNLSKILCSLAMSNRSLHYWVPHHSKATTSSMTWSTIWAQGSLRDVIGSEFQWWLYPRWFRDVSVFFFKTKWKNLKSFTTNVSTWLFSSVRDSFIAFEINSFSQRAGFFLLGTSTFHLESDLSFFTMPAAWWDKKDLDSNTWWSRIHRVLDVSHRNLIPLLSLSTWQCAIAMSRSHYLCSVACTALFRSLPLQTADIKRKRFCLLTVIQNTSPMTPKWPHSTDIQTTCTDCFVYLHQYSYTFVGLPAL